VGFDSYMNKIDRFKALGLGIKEINWN
jgi:hypothetical protein